MLTLKKYLEMKPDPEDSGDVANISIALPELGDFVAAAAEEVLAGNYDPYFKTGPTADFRNIACVLYGLRALICYPDELMPLWNDVKEMKDAGWYPSVIGDYTVMWLGEFYSGSEE